jgi:dihydrodipicolinate synthase/N-acetylneuraminate lyase
VKEGRTARLAGTFAASVTPLRGGGEELDEDAIGPLVDFLARSVDGILALGTTGEGILLSLEERERAAAAFVEAARGRVSLIVHCGAQTTRETSRLAAHACACGADAVAAIGPPYFAFDEAALLDHFAAAAAACAPCPFYLYEFAARTGYAVPLTVIERLRERAPNLVGLKVSDTPWEHFERYLLDGLDVFAGPEGLIVRALERGAVGAVSGLAAAFPEAVAAVVAHPSEEGAAAIAQLRATVQAFPFQAALKFVLGRRGVPLSGEVRRPLRTLSPDEQGALARALEQHLP